MGAPNSVFRGRHIWSDYFLASTATELSATALYDYNESNAGFTCLRGATGVTFSMPAASTAGAYGDGMGFRVRSQKASPDVEMLSLFTAQIANEQIPGWWARGNGTFGTTGTSGQDGGCIKIEALQGATEQLRFWNEAGTNVVNAAVDWTAADWWIRLAFIGTRAYARAWLATGIEPTTWHIDGSLTVAPGSGRHFGCGMTGGNSGTVDFTHIIKQLHVWDLGNRTHVGRRRWR